MKTKLIFLKKYVFPIAIFGLITIIFGAFFKISHYSFFGVSGSVLIAFGLIFSLIAWIVVLVDILQNKIENLFLWFLGLIFFGNITSIVYLSKRKF